MKRIIFAVTLLVASLTNIAQIFGQPAQDYVPGHLYFKLADNFQFQVDTTKSYVSISEKLPFLLPYIQTYGIDSVRSTFYASQSTGLRRTLRLFFNKTALTNQLLETMDGLTTVDYVEKVPLYVTSLSPNDLGSNSLAGQWGLYKINATAAWDLAQGYSTIIVAVVDNAIQTTHPDLASKMWPGYDVADGDNNPNPPNNNFSHGTHVAGIIGAATNNGVGIASIGYNTGIMPVKANKNTNSPNSISHGYEGVIWAADHGANIINMSWGGSGYSTTGANAIDYAWSRGVILVAAAGNNGTNAPVYPAAYSNVIAVAATDINDHVASFSNFGTYVDVCAPGVNIYSTVPSNNYDYKSGTSMAAPMVAGLAGLLMSAKSTVTRQEVIDCLLQTAVNIDGINAAYAGQLGSGRINAYEAVKCLKASCPDVLVLTPPFYNWNSGSHLMSTDISITAKNQLSGTAVVKYYAGNWIQLKAGFSSKCTSFQARIQGCTQFTSEQTEDREGFEDDLENSKKGNTQENITDSDGFKISPNPTSGDLKLHILTPSDNPTLLRLIDMQGKILRQETMASGETDFDFSIADLLPGIYLVGIQKYDGSMFYKKVLKL
jgi:subtilisin family serine protease